MLKQSRTPYIQTLSVDQLMNNLKKSRDYIAAHETDSQDESLTSYQRRNIKNHIQVHRTIEKSILAELERRNSEGK